MIQSNPVAHSATEASRPAFTTLVVMGIVALYATFHALTRLLSSRNLGEDDPLDNLLIQTLAPGYSVEQGPLYDWALWALQHIFGPTLPSFLSLKYGLLVIMAGYLFQITRHLTGSALWAFISVESMATIYQIFWRFHEGFTHRVGAMALTMATVWAIFRLADRPGRGNYLLLSVLIGLGLLTEHIYAFSLFAMLIAASRQTPLRRIVFSLPMLAVLPVSALIVSPYALWLIETPARLGELSSALLPAVPPHSLAGIGAGLRDALTFPLLVLSPYIVVLPMVFPAIFRSMFRDNRISVSDAQSFDPKAFLLHILLIQLAGLILFNGLLYTRSNYAVHSILPMMVIAIPWLTQKARETAPTPRRVRVFMSVLLAFTITAYAVRSGNLFVYEPFCSRCRWGIPYEDLAKNLRERGFEHGTIIVNDPLLGGNLRRFFPDSRITLLGLEAPQGKSEAGKTAIVWPSSPGNHDMPADLRSTLPGATGNAPMQLEIPWKHLWKPTGYRTSTWGAMIIASPD